MRRIQFVPGAIGAGLDITIPVPAPDIDAVVAAEITRLPTALGSGDHAAVAVAGAFDNHTQVEVIACVADHPQADVIDAFADHAMADVAAGVGNHTQAQVFACIADHAVHAHDLGVIVGVVAALEHYGASAGGAANVGATTTVTIPGGNPVTGGVLDNAAAQAHAGSTTDLVHGAGVNVDHAANVAVQHVGQADLEHVALAAVGHGAAADPVVAVAAVVRSTTRIVTFTAVAIVVGDLVTLVYQEVGEVVHTS